MDVEISYDSEQFNGSFRVIQQQRTPRSFQKSHLLAPAEQSDLNCVCDFAWVSCIHLYLFYLCLLEVRRSCD